MRIIFLQTYNYILLTIFLYITLETTSHCPSKPSGLHCLSNQECNRCIHAEPNTAAHEQCTLYSSTPLCDMDSATNATGIQATADLGFRKLSICAACNKDSKYLKTRSKKSKALTNDEMLKFTKGNNILI